jgi:hypothetical protein
VELTKATVTTHHMSESFDIKDLLIVEIAIGKSSARTLAALLLRDIGGEQLITLGGLLRSTHPTSPSCKKRKPIKLRKSWE